MAAKTKYNPDYHDDWAWSLAAMGATNAEIAASIGISERTVIRWSQQHESFGTAVAQGKEIADAKVIKSLYQRAVGYEYTEERQIVEVDQKTQIPKPVKIEKLKKHVIPDVGAQCFWLKNRQRNLWTDHPKFSEIEDLSEIEEEVYGNGGGADGK